LTTHTGAVVVASGYTVAAIFIACACRNWRDSGLLPLKNVMPGMTNGLLNSRVTDIPVIGRRKCHEYYCYQSDLVAEFR
jgi:hypothetical protein